MKPGKWVAAVGLVLLLLGGVLLAGWPGSPSPQGEHPPAAFDPAAFDPAAFDPEGFYLNASLRQGLRSSPPLWGPPLEERKLAGQVVVVAYFASWCLPCRTELAHLKSLARDFRERGLTIVAVNYFEEFDGLSNDRRLAAFLKRMNLPFAVVKGEAVLAQVLGPVTHIPTLLIFDRQGRLVTPFANGVPGEASLGRASLERHLAALL